MKKLVDDKTAGAVGQADEDRNETKKTRDSIRDEFKKQDGRRSYQAPEKPDETETTEAAKLLEQQKREAARAGDDA
jgi:hypothetical protein